ncbi:hypothetical protein G4B88_024488 [Cannabis sativa]|uniref:Uncharacterized protein n=1 Tax=Cannabis sativa TaxID=3483 RepID=A0A7J6DV47_CANSA|nr:hypothetical protein G4B88_024488 [Cannabis sativa]
MPDGASRRRSRRGFHGTPGLGRDLGNVVILGTVKTDLGKTLSFIVHHEIQRECVSYQSATKKLSFSLKTWSSLAASSSGTIET